MLLLLLEVKGSVDVKGSIEEKESVEVKGSVEVWKSVEVTVRKTNKKNMVTLDVTSASK